MEQSEVELNEKLAKWAGVLVSIESWPDEEPIMHVYDTEQENLIGESSPFTESLDACFKWLVPKLDQLSITVWDNVQMYAMVYRDEHDHMGYEAEDKNKTPALALCKAIEKMIDSAK